MSICNDIFFESGHHGKTIFFNQFLYFPIIVKLLSILIFFSNIFLINNSKVSTTFIITSQGILFLIRITCVILIQKLHEMIFTTWNLFLYQFLRFFIIPKWQLITNIFHLFYSISRFIKEKKEKRSIAKSILKWRFIFNFIRIVSYSLFNLKCSALRIASIVYSINYGIIPPSFALTIGSSSN